MESKELAGALVGLWRWAQEHADSPEPEIRRRLREHLGADPAGLEVLNGGPERLRPRQRAGRA
jgi:hypothetical protein